MYLQPEAAAALSDRRSVTADVFSSSSAVVDMALLIVYCAGAVIILVAFTISACACCDDDEKKKAAKAAAANGGGEEKAAENVVEPPAATSQVGGSGISAPPELLQPTTRSVDPNRRRGAPEPSFKLTNWNTVGVPTVPMDGNFGGGGPAGRQVALASAPSLQLMTRRSPANAKR